MLGVYIYVCIYTGEIVRIDLEMRILRAECVLRGCSGGALVHTFPSSFSSISPGSGSTPFFTLPRLRFASQTYPIFWRMGHATRSRISSLRFYYFFISSLWPIPCSSSRSSQFIQRWKISRSRTERRSDDLSMFLSIAKLLSFVARKEFTRSFVSDNFRIVSNKDWRWNEAEERGYPIRKISIEIPRESERISVSAISLNRLIIPFCSRTGSARWWRTNSSKLKRRKLIVQRSRSNYCSAKRTLKIKKTNGCTSHMRLVWCTYCRCALRKCKPPLIVCVSRIITLSIVDERE